MASDFQIVILGRAPSSEACAEMHAPHSSKPMTAGHHDSGRPQPRSSSSELMTRISGREPISLADWQPPACIRTMLSLWHHSGFHPVSAPRNTATRAMGFTLLDWMRRPFLQQLGLAPRPNHVLIVQRPAHRGITNTEEVVARFKAEGWTTEVLFTQTLLPGNQAFWPSQASVKQSCSRLMSKLPSADKQVSVCRYRFSGICTSMIKWVPSVRPRSL